MSLQNLKIPLSLISELYGNYLIEPGDNTRIKADSFEQPTKKLQESIPFLGGNAKQIIIIVEEASQPYMQDEDLSWLQKMLQACKLTLGDVAIVNIHPEKYPIANIRKQLPAKKLILLGPSPSQLQLPLNFPQFKLQEYDGCVFLYAPSPVVLNQETKEGKLLKSKLWVSLQKLFEE